MCNCSITTGKTLRLILYIAAIAAIIFLLTRSCRYRSNPDTIQYFKYTIHKMASFDPQSRPAPNSDIAPLLPVMNIAVPRAIFPINIVSCDEKDHCSDNC